MRTVTQLEFRLQLELFKTLVQAEIWENKLKHSVTDEEKKLARGYVYQLHGKLEGLELALMLSEKQNRPA
jgi:hypothetical protein